MMLTLFVFSEICNDNYSIFLIITGSQGNAVILLSVVLYIFVYVYIHIYTVYTHCILQNFSQLVGKTFYSFLVTICLEALICTTAFC